MAEPNPKFYRRMPEGTVVHEDDLADQDIPALIRKKELEPWNEAAVKAHERAEHRVETTAARRARHAGDETPEATEPEKA